MLKNSEEYRAMFDTEEKLWWYKILHEKVHAFLKQNNYPAGTKILDAGCGTGGLISFLQEKGFNRCKGFDFSEDAVALSSSRGFDVMKLDITRISDYFKEESFDLIVCNDVLYQFDDPEIVNILEGLFSRLVPGGYLLSNNQAFKVFSGTHDIAVGSKKRFRLGDFRNLSKQTGLFSISAYTYWSFLLSPVIFLVRSIQRIQLRSGLIHPDNVRSDVGLPPPFLNSLLYRIVRSEERLFKSAPFGSSLFLILKKSQHITSPL